MNRRVPTLVLIAATLAAAIGFGDGDAVKPRSQKVIAASSAPAVLASGAVRSAAWYCPMATIGKAIPNDDSIVIANLETKIVTVDVSALRDGAIAGRKRVEIVGRARTSIAIRSVAAKGDAGLLVESFGPGIIVEHHARGGGGASGLAPCATQASSQSYFPAVTTRKGTTAAIALLNPFGQHAVVDISFVTTQGSLRPGALQGFDIGARTREVIVVNAFADQRDVMAVQITARASARFVAELIVGDTAGRAGARLSVAVGSPAPQRQWHLVDIDADAQVRHEITIANHGSAAIEVSVQTLREGANQVQQADVTVEAGTMVVVDPAAIGASRKDATVIAFSQQSDFVAGDLITETVGARRSTFPSMAFTTAASMRATRSVFAVDRLDDLDRGELMIENVNDQAVTVIARFGGGAVVQRTVVPANERVTVRMRVNTVTSTIVVESDFPVFVARRLYGAGGISRSPAIPQV